MHYRKWSVLFYILLLSLPVFSNIPSSRGDSLLKVGDQLPQDISLRLLNYEKKTAPISEFRNKILILDFWNTHCAACFTSFPKIEALQKHFKGQISVLLVTDDSESKVQEAFRFRKKQGVYVPPMAIACGDQELQKLFSHQIEPHEVWIDETGKVIHVSSDEELTTKNIECVLEGKDCDIPQKNDYIVPYDYNQPLFKNGNGGNGAELRYHSVLSGYLDGLPASSGYLSNPQKPYGQELWGISVLNSSVTDLFSIAFDPGLLDNGLGQMGMPESQVIIEMKDTLQYCPYVAGKKAVQNWYCYDLAAPVSTAPELKRMMQSDLKRYFKLEAHLEKRTTKCLVLTMADTSLISSKDTVRHGSGIEDFKVYMRNVPFQKLIFWLTYRYHYPYPLIDETGIKGRVNMEFEADNSNYESVARALKKYNMNLMLEDRSIDILVIRDQKAGHNEQ